MPLCLLRVCDLTFWGSVSKKKKKKEEEEEKKKSPEMKSSSTGEIKLEGKNNLPYTQQIGAASAQQPPELSLKAKLQLLI